MSSTRRAVWVTEKGHAVDGEWRPNPPGFAQLTLAELFRALMTIVCGRGVAILDGPLAARFGFPDDKQLKKFRSDDYKNHGCAVELRSAGFTVREINRWFHVKHPLIGGRGGVWFALAGAIGESYSPIFGGSRKKVTAALAAWDEITGHPYRGSACDAGNVILTGLRYKQGNKMVAPKWWSNGAVNQPEGFPGEQAFIRQDWRSGVLGHPPVLHGLDRVRAYLSAMTCVKVAGQELVHDHRCTYDEKRAGFYRVRLSPWEFAQFLPDPAGYRHDPVLEDGSVWLAHPTVDLLAELAAIGFYQFEILDSWTAPAVPILKTYAGKLKEHWNATLAIPDPEVQALVRASMKGNYRQASGMWSSRTGEVQRRDWAAALVSQPRCNLWRELFKLWRGQNTFDGPTPMFIETDDVYFAEQVSPEGWKIHDPEALPAGLVLDDITNLGDWRRSKTLAAVSRETAAA